MDVRIMAFRTPICQVGFGGGVMEGSESRLTGSVFRPGTSRSFASFRMTNFMGLDDRVVETSGRTNASAPTWFVVIIAASSL